MTQLQQENVTADPWTGDEEPVMTTEAVVAEEPEASEQDASDPLNPDDFSIQYYWDLPDVVEEDLREIPANMAIARLSGAMWMWLVRIETPEADAMRDAQLYEVARTVRQPADDLTGDYLVVSPSSGYLFDVARIVVDDILRQMITRGHMADGDVFIGQASVEACDIAKFFRLLDQALEEPEATVAKRQGIPLFRRFFGKIVREKVRKHDSLDTVVAIARATHEGDIAALYDFTVEVEKNA